MKVTPHILFTGGVLWLFSVAASAQQPSRKDTVIKSQTIEIIQSYKPEIVRQEKPALRPSLPRIDTSRPRFQYEVPQQTLSYTYHSVPIRPLALGRREEIVPFQNYVKAGLGNLSSIYLDAGVGSLKGDHYETAIHATHHSQKGPLQHQQSSVTSFDAAGKYYMEDHVLGANLDISRNGYTFYGYDHDTFEYNKDGIRQVFTGIALQLRAENTRPDSRNVMYKPVVDLGLYQDRFQAIERRFAFDLPATLAIDSQLNFSLGLQGDFVQFKNDSFQTGNNFIRVNPAFDLSLGTFKLHLGLSPAWGKDNIAYLLPDLHARTSLLGDKLVFLMGWKADLVQNTYQQLSTKNPFINNVYPVRQTKTHQLFAGFESAWKEHLSFGGTLSWRQWQNLALFINDYETGIDGKKFATVYDTRVQALSLDASIRYQMNHVFGLSAKGSWYNFYHTETYNRVWHEPMVRMGASMHLQPMQQLLIQVNADFWDGMYSRRADGIGVKMPAFLDLSAYAEFRVIPRLSLFLQLNNILNTKYERWYQYPSYGFNITGGLRFKF